jgi:hypothetical protein
VVHVEGYVRTCTFRSVGACKPLSFAFLGRPISAVGTFSVMAGRGCSDVLGHASRVGCLEVIIFEGL